MIKLRVHHGLCIQHFIGKGYNEKYIKNMTEVINKLRSDPNQDIILHNDIDTLCIACPHNHESKCVMDCKVKEIDNNCFSKTGLKSGQIITWSKFEALINDKIIKSGNLSSVCKDCEWLNLCNKKKGK